jgi:hypothetical protein
MQAIQELMQLKEGLQKHIGVLQSEMTTVDKAIQLLEREGQRSPQSLNDRRFAKIGLSDSCRLIVGDDWISPGEIRDRLMQGGYKNDSKSKLLGSVFATCKRLAKAGQFEVKRLDEKQKYRKRQSVSAAEASA